MTPPGERPDRPPERETGPPPQGTGTHQNTYTAEHSSSHQVSWWSVCQYVEALLADVGPFPMAGTPAWCLLDDDDPRKLASLLDAAQHWALRVELCQEARCEASRDISATPASLLFNTSVPAARDTPAANWSKFATEHIQLRSFHATRPWMRRKVAGR